MKTFFLVSQLAFEQRRVVHVCESLKPFTDTFRWLQGGSFRKSGWFEHGLTLCAQREQSQALELFVQRRVAAGTEPSPAVVLQI